jgi:predicted transcriptional regulator
VLPLEDVVRQIRRSRLQADLTQADLAKAAGTSQSLIAKLERGRLNPSYEVVRKLLETLDRLATDHEPSAGDLMNAQPIFAEPSEALGKALDRMKKHGYSQLPVVDRGQPVGSVSESAILGLIERGSELDALRRQPVRLSMGSGFPTVEPETRKRTVVELLKDHDAVLVVREGKLVGLVTKTDILR